MREEKKKRGESKQSEDPGLEGEYLEGSGLRLQLESSPFPLTQILSVASILIQLSFSHWLDCTIKEKS